MKPDFHLIQEKTNEAIKASMLKRMMRHSHIDMLKLAYSLCAMCIDTVNLPRGDGTRLKLSQELDEVAREIKKNNFGSKARRIEQATALNALEMNSASLLP